MGASKLSTNRFSSRTSYGSLLAGNTAYDPSVTVNYLVVAGGGGGGSAYGAGGGAGGLRSTVTASGGSPGTVETALSLTISTNYTVTVGAGGAGGLAGYNATILFSLQLHQLLEAVVVLLVVVPKLVVLVAVALMVWEVHQERPIKVLQVLLELAAISTAQAEVVALEAQQLLLLLIQVVMVAQELQ